MCRLTWNNCRLTAFLCANPPGLSALFGVPGEVLGEKIQTRWRKKGEMEAWPGHSAPQVRWNGALASPFSYIHPPPTGHKACSSNPLGNSGRGNPEPVCKHLGTFHENYCSPEGFCCFHPQPLLLTLALPHLPPNPAPLLSPAGPSRSTLVPGMFFGSVLLHGPVSARRQWVGRNTP